MAERPTIHIAAGGEGTRLREGMEQMGFGPGFPKHLLPTGSGETLLGRIVRQTMEVGHPAIYANYENVRSIGESPDIPDDITLSIARNCNGPLSPLVHDIERTRKRTLACAGDFWADFKWGDFLDFHESQDTPVSILVAPSVSTVGGARFNVNSDGVVDSWERVESTTTPNDLINIGAYIVDPEKLVMRNLRKLDWHKEDPFNDAMIQDGLMSAYVLPTTAYNVNNPQVYAELVRGTSSVQG
jgi:NDP-sugar pyrophosphorylase family protein